MKDEAAGATLHADPDAIARHVDLLFGYLEGLAPVRIFPEKGTHGSYSDTPFLPADARLAEEIVGLAGHAASRSSALYVVPGTVTGRRARAEDIRQTGVVMVDLDSGDVGAARDHLVRHLGAPSMAVASGGITGDGQRRLHLYWRLTEPATGTDLERVRAMREAIAAKAGGDPQFKSLSQPIRVAGSVHGKFGRTARAEILAETGREVDLAEFEERVAAMPGLEGLDVSSRPARHGGPSARDLLTMQIREGARDEETRFAALSKVMGHWIRLSRIGTVTPDEAWAASCEYNAARIVPPWPENRLRREFEALLRRDSENHGVPAMNGAADAAPGELSIPPAEMSDDALASAFTGAHRAHWRFDGGRQAWMRWDGTRWHADALGGVLEAVRQVCRQVGRGCTPTEARRLSSMKTIQAVERIARSDPAHATSGNAWDGEPMILNTPAAILDLATGERLAHDPGRLVTRITCASHGRDCPNWTAFIAEITGGDEALAAYLQRLAGYCLTGDISEQVFFFAHGIGANGKSVFIDTLAHVLGDYAIAAPLDAFMAARGDRNSADLACLKGARLVTVTETEPGRAWAESRIKTVTGGDRIRARHLYGHYFEFTPTFKLIVAGNHRPSLGSVSEAMRRRLHLIPFEVVIPEERRDRQLSVRLRAEADGILGWMLEGCAEWRRKGLAAPPRVRQSSDQYFEDEDLVGQWIDEACVTGPDHNASSAALYGNWSDWADRHGVPPGSSRALGEVLKARGFRPWRSRHGRGWQGIAPGRGAVGAGEPT